MSTWGRTMKLYFNNNTEEIHKRYENEDLQGLLSQVIPKWLITFQGRCSSMGRQTWLTSSNCERLINLHIFVQTFHRSHTLVLFFLLDRSMKSSMSVILCGLSAHLEWVVESQGSRLENWKSALLLSRLMRGSWAAILTQKVQINSHLFVSLKLASSTNVGG